MNDVVVQLDSVSKFYKLYSEPRDRLKEALNPFRKKYHKDYFALSKINLQVKKGEILGVVGKNGSGKSTLLKVICGVLQPNSGTASISGKVSALLELGAGFNPEFTGLENIYFYGSILGLSKAEIDESLEAILTFADIGEFINQPIKTYSSGMKSRLGFSVAVHIKPDILIVDEVLSVGDAAFQKKSLKKMESLVTGGATVIFVSHSQAMITRFCDQAIYLRRGELVLKGESSNVVRLYMKDSESSKQMTVEELQRELEMLETGDVLNTTLANSTKPIDKSMFSAAIEKKSQPIITQNFPVNLISTNILNMAGQRVNVLDSGKKYNLECCYEFDRPTEGVVFPFSFYNEKSIEVFGIRYPSDGGSILVTENQKRIVLRCAFVADFVGGSYHFSVGITQLTGEGKSILFRCEDVVSFDVIQDEEIVQWGLAVIDTDFELEARP